MRLEMRGKLVERLLDAPVIGDIRLAPEALEPCRALAVVHEQPMQIGADHAPIGRLRAFRRAVGEMGEGPRAIGAVTDTLMDLETGIARAVDAAAFDHAGALLG